MKKRQAMRRARRTLCVLLPILVFSLAVLFIVSRRVEEARSRQETPSDYADAETIPALTQEPEEPDQEPSEPPESTPSGT